MPSKLDVGAIYSHNLEKALRDERHSFKRLGDEDSYRFVGEVVASFGDKICSDYQRWVDTGEILVTCGNDSSHVWTISRSRGNTKHCPKCMRAKVAKHNSTDPEEGIRNARNQARVFGGECLTENYLSYDQRMLWKCSDDQHPPFWSTYTTVVKMKRWCNNCAISKRKGGKVSEGKVRRFVEVALGKNFPSIKPEWNTNQIEKNPYILDVEIEMLKLKRKQKRKLPLELDGYCEELKLAFEYQGIQHYELESLCSSEKRYKRHADLKLCDCQKKRNCKRNGVKLVEIPYFDANKHYKFDYVKKVVVKAFRKVGVKLTYTEEQLQQLKNEFSWVPPKRTKKL